MQNPRVRLLNAALLRPDAEYVLYWAQMNRRVFWNHALSFAAGLANELKLPLLYYEGLTCAYPHASDRLHTFVLESVPDTQAALDSLGIGYCFYLRKRRSDTNDILYRLAGRAAALVTDDYPTFVAATHNARVPSKIDVPYYVVDASCIVPMGLIVKREYAAYTIRPKLQRLLPEYLEDVPEPKPSRRWSVPEPQWHCRVVRDAIPGIVADCEIDHTVRPSTAFRGGSRAACARLRQFLEKNLRRYAREKNEPSAHATSHLSPYLHFGHVSSLEVALETRRHASANKLIGDEFLEELIVRRELAFNFSRFTPAPGLDALPEWALKTLAAHRNDRRDPEYCRAAFESAGTHDPLWNATQKELLLRGTIHGYYRMYWGKKIIEWSHTYEEAYELMVYLHDRYALDGRDPNTYTNILWCFGLHDRPWFDRPVFGQVRYMSFEGMKRQTNVDAYIREIEHLERTGQDFLA